MKLFKAELRLPITAETKEEAIIEVKKFVEKFNKNIQNYNGLYIAKLEEINSPSLMTDGALFPDDLAWMKGREIQDIAFAQDASKLIELNKLNKNQKYLLNRAINEIKDGTRSIPKDVHFNELVDSILNEKV